MQILDFEQQLMDKMDANVAHASDDELFANGYLRGHISLAVAQCEAEGLDDLEQLKSRINASLKQAEQELTPQDRVVVAHFWQQLQ
ncbi:hypothetical protein VST7929_01846 [Vibrio stylophorae]|uniref:YfcL family protein n=1 Tax=Vibrio stylophorae TaxID=659351 RepID=A0ABM8ZUH0_9VIBR|nr:YfcL family protein [Vibrio stylophorae]CAH0533964.1 hypothetical protein VST7929_01846 [Vibrio stylophorae]